MTPGATAQLTFHVPIELMDEHVGNIKKFWCPTLFHFHNAVKVRWIYLDEDLERVLDWGLNDSRVIAHPDLGIMTCEFYQRKFAQPASPQSGMVRSSGNDNDEESEIEELDLEDQNDSSVALSPHLSRMTNRSENEMIEEALRRSIEDDEVRETNIAGIVNNSNTCYINSALQVLFSDQQFLSTLSRFYSKSTQKNELPLTENLMRLDLGWPPALHLTS